MLYLLSISATLVGSAVLVALILFSHRNDDSVDDYEGGERESFAASPTPSPGALIRPDSRDKGGGAPREHGAPPKGAAGRERTSGVPPGSTPRGAAAEDGGVTQTAASSPSDSSPAVSIPIVRPETAIPGLGAFELVHFLGKAGLGTLEDQRELDEVQIEETGPQLEIQGELALTSRNIIVFDAKTSKKIPFGVIETYRFHDSFLLIKKKNVKKKKTLLKIFGNVGDFQYILDALIPL